VTGKGRGQAVVPANGLPQLLLSQPLGLERRDEERGGPAAVLCIVLPLGDKTIPLLGIVPNLF